MLFVGIWYHLWKEQTKYVQQIINNIHIHSAVWPGSPFFSLKKRRKKESEIEMIETLYIDYKTETSYSVKKATVAATVTYLAFHPYTFCQAIHFQFSEFGMLNVNCVHECTRFQLFFSFKNRLMKEHFEGKMVGGGEI